MPQQTEQRLLTGGTDSDSADHEIAPDAVLNMVNIRVLRQKKQSGGKAEKIIGNNAVAALNSVLTGVAYTLLGKCTDDDTGCLYLFLWNAGGDHCIAEYNATANTARLILEESNVTGGLGWTNAMFIDCEAGNRELFFVDGVNDLRYVNLDTTYGAGTSQSQLSLVAEPGMVPPTKVRTTVAGGASTIQETALQFSYRISNTDGHQSVLSPYSLTAIPTRSSDLLIDSDIGKGVTVTIPTAQPIPTNWDRVELIARFMESNTFYVIRRWDKDVATDVTEVAAHNATTTPLTLTDWTGDTIEAVDAVYAAKQADAIPQAPAHLRLAANRLLLANFTEGYDTPAEIPAITATGTTFNPSLFSNSAPSPPTPTYQNYIPYIIIVGEDGGSRNWWFAIILRFNSKNYLLPKETSIGKFYYDNNTLPNLTNIKMPVNDGLFNMPESVSTESLYELKESGDPAVLVIQSTLPTFNNVRKNIVKEANSLPSLVDDTSGAGAIFLFPMLGVAGAAFNVKVETDTAEFGPSSESRAFLPVPYNKGVQYYDRAGRKSGVVSLGTTTFTPYDVTAPEFTNMLTFTLPAVTSAIPDWAEYFSITLSKAARAKRFGFFFGGIVKAMFKSGDTIIYGDPVDLVTVPAGRTIYGIGVPIPSTFNYAFTEGDYVMYSHATGSGTAKIIGTYAGHIVLQYTNSATFMQNLCDGYGKHLNINNVGGGTPSGDVYLDDSTKAQNKTSFILVSGVESAINQYEVAAFGNITGSVGNKQFGNFYSTGTQSIDIYGDTHTQKRLSNAGGGTGIAMSTHEDAASTFWVNDLGRPAPADSVGQKTLSNYVRFSNARIPGATINGYASFDAADYETTDISAGAITYLALTTRGAQEGGQLLALCEHGSFASLVGQQQIAGADGKNAFTATVNVIGKFNSLRGGWGCQSPRSVVPFEGKVWWVDAYKRNIIEFNESGAQNIANFKAARLWNTLLSNIADPRKITAGIDPFSADLMVSVPASAYTKLNLITTDLPDPLDMVYNDGRTYFYNWEANKWEGSYAFDAERIHLGDRIFAFKDGQLWQEFTTGNTYYGEESDAMIAIPFNANYPAVKSPLSIKLDTEHAPDTTWIVIRKDVDSVTSTQRYKIREGDAMSPILRNRVSSSASNPTAWQLNSINGHRLKGQTIVAVLIWSGEIGLSSAALTWNPSSGH